MTKDDIQDLAVGAVLVVLAYAVYRHFKTAPAAAPAPRAGVAVGEPPPSPFTTLQDLLSGTVQDIGSFGGRNYLNEIADPGLNGNQGRDSIVMPGALW